MHPIISREYKVMLDHRMFASRKDSLRDLRRDLKRLGKRVGVALRRKFDRIDKRTVQFLDTVDYTFRHNELILRKRTNVNNARAEFTLKCRLEDRYFADGVDLRPATGIKPEKKFEEDIAAPFRSRFSRSVTIAAKDGPLPTTVSAAGELFPILSKVRCNGKKCSGKTPVQVVRGFTAHERVHKAPRFDLGGGVQASVAVILWSHRWKDRIVAAELSFRYGDPAENYPLKTVKRAFQLFMEIHTLDWCLPGGTTKTQFAYGS